MLGKLIKYDMRSLRRVLLPMVLAIPVSAIFCTAALRFIIVLINSDYGNFFTTMLIATCGLFVFANAVVILLLPTATLIFTMVNFYRTLYTDEGYLTFTLPVKTADILNSKFLTAVIWSVISIIVSVLSALFVLLLGTSPDSLINLNIIPGLIELLQGITELFTTSGVVVYSIFYMVSGLYQITVLFLAITIGSVIAKKHKALAAVGIYYVINLAASLVTNVLTLIMMFSSDFSDESVLTLMFTISSPIINMILYLGFAVAAYITTLNLMKNRLNLS